MQTSLRHVNDTAAIVKQCHFYANAFEEQGVPRDRFAIKLPFSGAAATAARELNAEGIRTLATAVFSLEQAIAASQSDCLFISPYYNGKLKRSQFAEDDNACPRPPRRCIYIYIHDLTTTPRNRSTPGSKVASGRPRPCSRGKLIQRYFQSITLMLYDMLYPSSMLTPYTPASHVSTRHPHPQNFRRSIH